MKAPREGDLLAACLMLLNLHGVFCWRVNSGCAVIGDGKRRRFIRFTTINGLADICGVLPGGRALFVETKSKSGRLSPAQREFLRRAGELGALAVCVRSVDELLGVLRAEGVVG